MSKPCRHGGRTNQIQRFAFTATLSRIYRRPGHNESCRYRHHAFRDSGSGQHSRIRGVSKHANACWNVHRGVVVLGAYARESRSGRRHSVGDSVRFVWLSAEQAWKGLGELPYSFTVSIFIAQTLCKSIISSKTTVGESSTKHHDLLY